MRRHVPEITADARRLFRGGCDRGGHLERGRDVAILEPASAPARAAATEEVRAVKLGADIPGRADCVRRRQHSLELEAAASGAEHIVAFATIWARLTSVPKTRALDERQQPDVARLRTSVHRFVKAFGLLATDRTPCGTPVPLSCAYALVHLLEAGRRGEEPTQQELAHVLCVDKSNVARLCAKMERDGFARQRRSEHDGRSRRLTLTAKGKRLAERVESSSHARFARLLDAVPSHTRTTLLPALEALATAATQLDPEVSS